MIKRFRKPLVQSQKSFCRSIVSILKVSRKLPVRLTVFRRFFIKFLAAYGTVISGLQKLNFDCNSSFQENPRKYEVKIFN
jgi:hypothetical protein